MPARRGIEVDDKILYGPLSVVNHEAKNRIVVQMAVLHQIVGR
jgi:ornithine carbamoyltransferase